MIWLWLIPVLVVIALGLGVFAYRHVRLFGHHVQIERTQQLFLLQQDRLAAQFFQVASTSGEPTGLRWKSCVFNHDIIFVRERRTGQLTALVGMRAEFEHLDGINGEPASPSRQAAAFFYFQHGHWHTAGKAVFDRTPAEVLQQLEAQYQPLVRQ